MLILDTSKPVDRTGNTYCGPLVVGAILGTSTGIIAERIAGMRVARDPVTIPRGRKAPRRGPIRGTYYTELCALLERAGYGLRPVDVGARYRRSNYVACYIDAEQKRMYRGGVTPAMAQVLDLWAYTPLKRVCDSLGSFLRGLDAGTYIVNTPGHWAIASGGLWCETYTGGAWCAKRAAPKQTRRVLNAWQIERITP